jgi:hypothetical protein
MVIRCRISGRKRQKAGPGRKWNRWDYLGTALGFGIGIGLFAIALLTPSPCDDRHSDEPSVTNKAGAVLAEIHE